MADIPDTFVDEFSNLHYRGHELGFGGQGLVYRAKDSDIAIKISFDKKGELMPARGISASQHMLRLLPIPDDLPLAKPIAYLRDWEGYVMRLLQDMVPFTHFWPTGNSLSQIKEIPDWLSEMESQKDARALAYYATTGGLKRRLLALSKCSAILARLHAAGMVYGDISPANAYVSDSAESREVWLIDPDNLRFEKVGSRFGVYTPKFGAPELVQGNGGCSFKTDCYAFAVLAFWMLSNVHPFIGKRIEDDDGADWANETQEADVDPVELAYAGKLSWIDDQSDDSNASSGGLPRELVLTQTLRSLFESTFCEGRMNPSQRPGMLQWSHALQRAMDLCVTCPSCKMGYYFDTEGFDQECPYCGESLPSLLVVTRSDLNRDDDKDQDWTWVEPLHKTENVSIGVPDRLLYPFSPADADRDRLEIIVSSNSIEVRPIDGVDGQSLELRTNAVSGQTECFILTKRTIIPTQGKAAQIEIRVGKDPMQVTSFSIPAIEA